MAVNEKNREGRAGGTNVGAARVLRRLSKILKVQGEMQIRSGDPKDRDVSYVWIGDDII